MADEQPAYHTQRWTHHFEAIDLEIGQLAKVCQIPLLAPGVIERVLHNDALVCGHQNERAFSKLRQRCTSSARTAPAWLPQALRT